MSGYNIECFLYDFSRRTNKNLDIIYGIKEGSFTEKDLLRLKENSKENFEVTQLINSLLGLVILPIEASKKLCEDKSKKIPNTDFYSISEKDSDEIINLIDKCKKEKRYFSQGIESSDKNRRIGYFMLHIRNSLAHAGAGGLHFYPIEDCGNITDIIFYDKNIYNGHEFCVKLSIDEIKVLEKNINRLLCGFEEREKNCGDKVESYKKRVRKLEEKMQNYLEE